MRYVYLIFKCEFPTDFDGELIAAYLDESTANSFLRTCSDTHYLKKVELDD